MEPFKVNCQKRVAICCSHWPLGATISERTLGTERRLDGAGPSGSICLAQGRAAWACHPLTNQKENHWLPTKLVTWECWGECFERVPHSLSSGLCGDLVRGKQVGSDLDLLAK